MGKEELRAEVRKLIGVAYARAQEDAEAFVAGIDATIDRSPEKVARELLLGQQDTITAGLLCEAYREIFALREEVIALRAQIGEVDLG